MKYFIVSFILLGLVSCSEVKESKNLNLKASNLKGYYFPFSEKLTPTTYIYEVTTKTQNEDVITFEYIKLKKIGGNLFSMSSFGEELNLVDSTVFKVGKKGTSIYEYYIVSEDQSLVSASVSPKLVFPWYRTVDEQLSNSIVFSSVMYGAKTNTEMLLENQFKGFVEIENSISSEISCASIAAKTKIEFKNIETGQIVNYSASAEIYDLKGVGLYMSKETNNYGVTKSKKLIEIKKTPNNM